MPGFELDIPRASTPSPGSVPKIPLGVVGNPGMERFGTAVEGAANTAGSALNVWNQLQKDTQRQNAATWVLKQAMELENRDYNDPQGGIDRRKADALTDSRLLPTLANDHLGFLSKTAQELGAQIPNDPYAQHHWMQYLHSYMNTRRGELRSEQTNLLVKDFESTLKNRVAEHESKISAAPTLMELSSVSDDAAIRELDQSFGSAVQNRVMSKSQADEMRNTVQGNFRVARFTRWLELDPSGAAANYRAGEQLTPEDILQLVPSPERYAGFAGERPETQQKLRDAYHQRVVDVVKRQIDGGRVTQATVLTLQDHFHFPKAQYDDLMHAATAQAASVRQAEEHAYQADHRAAEQRYRENLPQFWSALFDRKLTPKMMDAGVAAGFFAAHPEMYHTLYQAMEQQHHDDASVDAKQSFGLFKQLETQIKANPEAADVQPDRWIQLPLSFGQKSSLYSTLREWQDKAADDPRFKSQEYKDIRTRIVTDTGGDFLQWNTDKGGAELLQMRSTLLSMLSDRVQHGATPLKAYGEIRKYLEAHPPAGYLKTRPAVKDPNYTPLTVEQITARFAAGSPAYYDALADLKAYTEAQRAAAEAAAAAKAQADADRLQQELDAQRPSWRNGYGLFTK